MEHAGIRSQRAYSPMLFLCKGLEHLQIWISTGSRSQLPSDIKRWLYFRVNEQTIHYSSLHWKKSINLFIRFLLHLYDALWNLWFISLFDIDLKLNADLGEIKRGTRLACIQVLKRKRTSRFLWCSYTLISTTLSLNCTVLGSKQRNPDSKIQS